jgi:hypothetical protein
MTTAAPAQVKIPTVSPQPGRSGRSAGRPVGRAGGSARGAVLTALTGRESSRGGGEVIELECGITVYPARSEGGRWRAVWSEAGQRQETEAPTEAKLASKLEKVTERLAADAPTCAAPAPPSSRTISILTGSRSRTAGLASTPTPSGGVAKLGLALAAGAGRERGELMANAASYSGLRWGELAALTIPQVDVTDRVITVGRKVVEVGGRPYVEAPQKPQAPPDDLPPPHPRWLPTSRSARRPDRASPRRAGSRHQPARADLPLPQGRPLALFQLQPPHPGPGLPRSRLARLRPQQQVDLALPPPRLLHRSLPVCSPGSLNQLTCLVWPARPTTASRSTCTSEPPSAFSTAPARRLSNQFCRRGVWCI